MTAEQIIRKKRDGFELTETEIRYFVEGFVKNVIPDYQMSAFLMAIYFQGMTGEEIYYLTKVMIESGKQVDLSHLNNFPIDKHSTGGVGDKVSLVLAPLMACAGLTIPMISGRGLGHSGGTLDKLEAIPGFRTNLKVTEFIVQLEKIGVAMIGQTEEIVPADKKIYALRDSTGTVPSIPLIVGSILSKKIAEGARALVLDVKVGTGAFFKSHTDAIKLTNRIISISEKFGLKTTGILTAMDQPLGNTIGNWVETKEAIQTLQGNGPDDLVKVTLALGAEMLYQANNSINLQDTKNKLSRLLTSGKTYEKFVKLVEAQNGDVSVVENPERYKVSQNKILIPSRKKGVIHSIDSMKIGLLAMELGAGRKKISDSIDYLAGIVLKAKVGTAVNIGDPLAEVLYSANISKNYIEEKIIESIEVKEEKVAEEKLLLKYVDKSGVVDYNTRRQ